MGVRQSGWPALALALFAASAAVYTAFVLLHAFDLLLWLQAVIAALYGVIITAGAYFLFQWAVFDTVAPASWRLLSMLVLPVSGILLAASVYAIILGYDPAAFASPQPSWINPWSGAVDSATAGLGVVLPMSTAAKIAVSISQLTITLLLTLVVQLASLMIGWMLGVRRPHYINA